MLLSNVTTSFLFLMSHLFWMFPTVILLSKRATAYAPLRIAERALRTRARGPLVSLAPRNNFLIARKSNLEDREVQTLQMIAHWTIAHNIHSFRVQRSHLNASYRGMFFENVDSYLNICMVYDALTQRNYFQIAVFRNDPGHTIRSMQLTDYLSICLCVCVSDCLSVCLFVCYYYHHYHYYYHYDYYCRYYHSNYFRYHFFPLF